MDATWSAAPAPPAPSDRDQQRQQATALTEEVDLPTITDHAIFPPLQARNLNARTLALPAEFAGVRNVLIVAFRREHQQLVDSWFPALDPLLAAYSDLRAYELPMIASGYALVRPFIDGGMAGAIPSPTVRERTLTVYTDVARFRALLQISSPETITILLVDRSGKIFWRSLGAYTVDKGAELARALAEGQA